LFREENSDTAPKLRRRNGLIAAVGLARSWP
jgi:hypothetical protein